MPQSPFRIPRPPAQPPVRVRYPSIELTREQLPPLLTKKTGDEFMLLVRVRITNQWEEIIEEVPGERTFVRHTLDLLSGEIQP